MLLVYKPFRLWSTMLKNSRRERERPPDGPRKRKKKRETQTTSHALRRRGRLLYAGYEMRQDLSRGLFFFDFLFI
jgi:hypothetical protein